MPPLPGTPGQPGLAYNIISGSLDLLAGSPRRFELTSPVREGGSTHVTLEGLPGDLVSMLHSTRQGSTWVPEASGQLVLGTPYDSAFLGFIPAAGTLALDVPVPPLPLGFEGMVVYTQGLVSSAAGELVLASPSALVILDKDV